MSILRNIRWSRLCVICALALLLAVPTSSCGSTDATSTTTTSDTGVEAPHAVRFATDDGVTLKGHLFGSGDAGVILAHMYPADQTSWYPAAERLAQEGYLVLTFDFRGYGESGGTKQIDHIDRDVLAAIRELGAAGTSRVVLIGASMGGTASLIAADTSQVLSDVRVVGVATLSAPVEFKGLSARQAAARLLCPILLVAAEDDPGAVGAQELQTLVAGKGDLQIVPGADHGTDLLTGGQADTVYGLLLQFLKNCLP